MTKSRLPDPRLFSHLQWKPGMPKHLRKIRFPVYGRFSVQRIEEDATWYIFTGLTLPIGTYSQLVMGKEPLLGGKRMTFQEWKDYNSDESAVKSNGGFRVMPAWIRYALSNVCYQSKGQSDLSQLIENMRQTVLTGLGECYNSTSIELFPNNLPAMITYASGWPAYDPFNQVNNNTPLCEENGQSIPALKALLFEKDPKRVHEVSNWVMGRPNGMARSSEWNSYANNSRMMIWGIDQSIDIDIFSDSDGNFPRQAYGIHAKPHDFKQI